MSFIGEEIVPFAKSGETRAGAAARQSPPIHQTPCPCAS
jgi:hypothetical protein